MVSRRATDSPSATIRRRPLRPHFTKLEIPVLERPVDLGVRYGGEHAAAARKLGIEILSKDLRSGYYTTSRVEKNYMPPGLQKFSLFQIRSLIPVMTIVDRIHESHRFATRTHTLLYFGSRFKPADLVAAEDIKLLKILSVGTIFRRNSDHSRVCPCLVPYKDTWALDVVPVPNTELFDYVILTWRPPNSARN